MNEIDAMEQRPKLRPVEAFAIPGDGEASFAVRDPSGLAEAVLTLSEPALFILSLLDGTKTLRMVSEDFQGRYGQRVAASTLVGLVSNLESARLLDGAQFEAYVRSLEDAYRAAPVRKPTYTAGLGASEQVRASLDRMLSGAPSNHRDGWVVGVVAPHLDYPRGEPCYAAAYGALVGRPAPARCIILGTNHFGRSTSVVATGKAFETPLGVTEVDLPFLEAVEARCGDLRTLEFDHKREHSVELQVAWLQHLFGPDSFKLVPFLCPDPCGPTGTRPSDGQGVDLGDFAEALGATIAREGGDTLLVAGADLSHMGRPFGDRSRLSPDRLAAVERRDRRVLGHLGAGEPESFLRAVADNGNPTRVCSAGCLFVVSSVLRGSRAELLGYHQAFDEQTQTLVSCSAVAYTR